MKIEVVAGNLKVVFCGNELSVIDGSDTIGDAKLIIREKENNVYTTIAVFKQWKYWRKLRDGDQVLTDGEN